MPIMSTRSTYGYSKVTIQCTGSPSMRKVWDCDDIPGNTSCCRKVAKDKNANFLWVFWQIMGGFDDVNQINGPISTVLDIAGCSI